jgi:NAD(P)-dependent dehydrogenase (short-subunit alcohol dehydrogenase family)
MGRVLLITGSSGIAAATARLATSRGDAVFLIGKNHQEYAQLSSELNGSAYSVADVADENAVKDAVNLCLTQMHAIDAVFNGRNQRALVRRRAATRVRHRGLANPDYRPRSGSIFYVPRDHSTLDVEQTRWRHS